MTRATLATDAWPHRLTAVVFFIMGACATAAVSSEAASPGQLAKPAPFYATVWQLEATEMRVTPNKKGSIRFLARGRNAFVGLLTMDAGGQVPLHADATEEYIHILEGEGTITIDGKEYAVSPRTTIFMPAGAKVSYQNGASKMVALQVFAGPAPSAKYDKWQTVTR